MSKRKSPILSSRTIPDSPDTVDTRHFTVPNELVFHLFKFTPPAWMVYCVILKHAGNKSVAWPSLATIKELTGLSIPTIKRATKHLETIGVIKRQSEKGRVTQYILTHLLRPTRISRLTSEPTVGSPVSP